MAKKDREVIHYYHPAFKGNTRCGNNSSGRAMTEDTTKVNCKRCLKFMNMTIELEMTEEEFNDHQVGSVYQSLKIQPWIYAMANGMDFITGTVIKRVTAFHLTGDKMELDKAINELRMIRDFDADNYVKEVSQNPDVDNG